MDPPAWLARHLESGERVLWAQDIPPGAVWGAIGPLVGAGFALVFAGSAVLHIPGPWSWLLDPLRVPERAGVPSWVLAVAGAVGFVSLVAKHAVRESLSAWAVTDRRLLRVLRYAPLPAHAWPRAAVRVTRVKLKKRSARVSLAVPAPWYSFDRGVQIDAREGGARLVAAFDAPQGRAATMGPEAEAT